MVYGNIPPSSRKYSCFEEMPEAARKASIATITKGLPICEDEDDDSGTNVVPSRKNMLIFSGFGFTTIILITIVLVVGHEKLWSFVAAGILACIGGCCFIESLLLYIDSHKLKKRQLDLETGRRQHTGGPGPSPAIERYLAEKLSEPPTYEAVAEDISKPLPIHTPK